MISPQKKKNSGKNKLNTGDTDSTPTQLFQPSHTDPVQEGIPTHHPLPPPPPKRNESYSSSKTINTEQLECYTE